MIKNILAIIAILFSVIGTGQKINSSPYSLFGIGDETSLKSVEENTMGNMGSVLDSEYQLSLTNPATYGSLLWTTYVFSGATRVTNFDDGNESQTGSHTGLTYLAMGIPIRGNQGLAFGIQLNTSVGYSLIDQKFNEDEELYQSYTYEGEGGTNRAFLGYGYKFPFDLSLGVEAAYIFGGVENSILNRRLGVQLATKHTVDSYVQGFEFKTGAHFKYPISEDLEAKIGASFKLAHSLNDDGNEKLYTLNNSSDAIEIPKDTLYDNEYNGEIKYPLQSVLGVGLGKKNQWFVGAEYTFRDAIEFDGSFYENRPTYDYSNTSMWSVGGFYIPKFNSISAYWHRITYRAGFNYKKIGLTINNTEINDYGMSFGVSLPMGLTLSNVNLGFEFGKRGETTGNLVQENYFNFRLSLSLNDKWFYKRVLN